MVVAENESRIIGVECPCRQPAESVRLQCWKAFRYSRGRCGYNLTSAPAVCRPTTERLMARSGVWITHAIDGSRRIGLAISAFCCRAVQDPGQDSPILSVSR